MKLRHSSEGELGFSSTAFLAAIHPASSVFPRSAFSISGFSNDVGSAANFWYDSRIERQLATSGRARFSQARIRFTSDSNTALSMRQSAFEQWAFDSAENFESFVRRHSARAPASLKSPQSSGLRQEFTSVFHSQSAFNQGAEPRFGDEHADSNSSVSRSPTYSSGRLDTPYRSRVSITASDLAESFA